MKSAERRKPGKIAAANSLAIDTPTTGPRTTSMTLGGIRMPSVPPAVMTPQESAGSYRLLRMTGPAMIPRSVTEALTSPVAVAKSVAVRSTPR